jgi:raffinose/stachyose/melibiose transport system substrate-binding protein
MKKALILLLAMMIVVVAGCSSAGNKAEGGKNGEAAGDVTKLTMWSMETRNKAIIEKSIKQFNDEHPNIQLTAEFFEDEALKTKMKVAITGNQVPDIITYWSGETFDTLVSNSMLGDITEQLGKDEAFTNDVLNGGLETFSYDGKNYGIPVLFSGVSLWYNKQIFEENGLIPPTTYAELLTLVDQLNAKNIVPITVAGKDRWPVLHWFSYLAQRIGGMEPFESAQKGEADFTQDTFVKAGDMLRELAVDHKGFINGFLGLDYAAAESLFTSGKAAMYLQGEWAMNSFLDDDFADKVGFVPFPAVDGGKGGINIYQGGFGAGMAISSKTNQEAAYEAIRFLTDSVQRKEINEGANISPMKTPGLDQSKMNPLSYAYGSSISSSLEGFFSYYDQALDAKRAEQFLNSVGAIVGQNKISVKDELAKVK